MAQRELDIVSRVEDDFLRAQLGDYAVGTVVLMIDHLKEQYGDGFTIEGCLTALGRLSKSANDFHGEIEKASKDPKPMH